MAPVTLGVDLGSHGARAVVLDDGRVLARARVDHAVSPPARRSGQEVRRVFVECVRNLPAFVRRRVDGIGITGVPFFVADGKYAVSGAQPPEVLLQLLQRAYDETSQLTPVGVTTDSNSEASCDGDSCAVG